MTLTSSHGGAGGAGGGAAAAAAAGGCQCRVGELARLEEIQSPLDVRELAAAARASAAGAPSLAALRGWMSRLREAATSDSMPPSPTMLAAMEAPLQSMLLFAMGITSASDAPPVAAAAAAASTGPLRQLAQLRANNRILEAEGALSLYATLLHSVVSAHYASISALLPATAAAAASAASISNDGSEAHSPSTSSSTAAHTPARNPRDLFTKSPQYWRSDKLLRQVLNLLFVLIQSHARVPSFLHALLHRSHLLNVLWEMLSPPPLAEHEQDVLDSDVGRALRSEGGAQAQEGADAEEAEDEFVVEYVNGAAPPQPSPVKSKSISFSSPSNDAAAAPDTDPSPSIRSPWWSARARESFQAGLGVEHVSPVSYLPLTKVMALLRLVLEAIHADLVRQEPGQGPAAGSAAGSGSGSGVKTPMGTPVKKSALGTPRISVGMASPRIHAAGSSSGSSGISMSTPSKAGGASSKVGAAGSATPGKASKFVNHSGTIFCTTCFTLHCGGEEGSKSCRRSCAHPGRTLSQSSPAQVAFARHNQLYPCELQQICAILSVTHGAIFYAPSEAETPGPLSKHAALPVTTNFPFVVSNSALAPGVQKQLALLASFVRAAPGGGRAMEVQRPYAETRVADQDQDADAEVALLPEHVYAALMPAMQRHVSAIARLLLVLLPGFDERHVLRPSGSAPAAGGAEDALGSSGLQLLGGASTSTGTGSSFIDLRQLLLTPSSLDDATDSLFPPQAQAFYTRRNKEVLLECSGASLLALRSIVALVPDHLGPGAGECLEIRFVQQCMSQAGLPLLAAKLLNQDMERTLARHTETTPLGCAVMRGKDGWAKAGGATAAPAVAAASGSAPVAVPAVAQGLSTRLLRAFGCWTSVLHQTLDAPCTHSSLLAALPLYRAGVRRLLAQLLPTVLLKADSLTPLSESRSPAHRELLEWWRASTALALRVFDPFLPAEELKAETSVAAHPVHKARMLLAKQPSTTFHDGHAALLYRWTGSPLSGLSGLASVPLATHEACVVTQTLRGEIGAASRRRFPYGDAAPLPAVRGPSTGMTMSPPTPAHGGGGGGGGIGSAGPMEPPAEGSACGVLHQPVPAFAQPLCDSFLLARQGLPVPDARARVLDESVSVTRLYPSEHESLRLSDERNGKIDRLLSLESRAGAWASHPELKEYDLFAPSWCPEAGPLAPTRCPPAKLSLYHYLIVRDALRRWRTESMHAASYGVEMALIEPSLAHRPAPKTLAIRAARRRDHAARGRAERFLACAVSNYALQQRRDAAAAAATSAQAEAQAAAQAEANGDGADSSASSARVVPATAAAAAAAAAADDDFFAHPFLSSSSLTPHLLATLLSPTLAAQPSALTHRGEGADTAAAAARRAGPASIATGRLPLSEAELKRGYAQLIASANFD